MRKSYFQTNYLGLRSKFDKGSRNGQYRDVEVIIAVQVAEVRECKKIVL